MQWQRLRFIIFTSVRSRRCITQGVWQLKGESNPCLSPLMQTTREAQCWQHCCMHSSWTSKVSCWVAVSHLLPDSLLIAWPPCPSHCWKMLPPSPASALSLRQVSLLLHSLWQLPLSNQQALWLRHQVPHNSSILHICTLRILLAVCCWAIAQFLGKQLGLICWRLSSASWSKECTSWRKSSAQQIIISKALWTGWVGWACSITICFTYILASWTVISLHLKTYEYK